MTTEIDHYRTRRELARYLQSKDAIAHNACSQLAELLKHPGLPINNADSILQLLMETHESSFMRSSLANLLIDALHSDNPDVRARINHTLLYLADRWKVQLTDPELPKWQPSQSDSATDVETRITAWRRVFSSLPAR